MFANLLVFTFAVETIYSVKKLNELNVLSAKESSRRRQVVKCVNLVNKRYNDDILICYFQY